MKIENTKETQERCEPIRTLEELSIGRQPGDIMESPIKKDDSNISDAAQEKAGILELYEAWSVLNNFMGCDNASIHWHCMDRGRRRTQYKNLIADYEIIANNKEDIDYYGQYIDQLFSAEEICQLRKYLWESNKISLIAKRVDIPATIIENGPPHISMITDGFMCTINLTRDANNNLPFEVWGQYNTYRRPLTVKLPEAALKVLVRYSNNIFNLMGVSVPDDELKDTLIWLYDEYGLQANCEFASVDGTKQWFGKLHLRREHYTEKEFAKLLLRRFDIDMPNNMQEIVDSIAEKTGTFIVHGNNLSERIKIRQKYMEDLGKEKDAHEIADAIRSGTIDGDV